MELLTILEEVALTYIESNFFKSYDFQKEGLKFQVNEVFHEQLRKEANLRIKALKGKVEIEYLADFTYNFQGVPCIIHFETDDIDGGPGNMLLKVVLELALKTKYP